MVIVTFLFFEDTFANTGEGSFEDECTTDTLPLDYTVVLLKGLPEQNRCNQQQRIRYRLVENKYAESVYMWL